MPNYICELAGCEFETTNHSEYLAHRGGHMTGRIPIPVVDENYPPREPEVEVIVAEPIIEKPKLVPSNAPLSGKSPENDKKTLPVAPWQAEKNKREGVKLTYNFTGHCNQCGGNVETLELEDLVEDTKKLVVVCWCPTCRMKVAQRTVAKL